MENSNDINGMNDQVKDFSCLTQLSKLIFGLSIDLWKIVVLDSI